MAASHALEVLVRRLVDGFGADRCRFAFGESGPLAATIVEYGGDVFFSASTGAFERLQRAGCIHGGQVPFASRRIEVVAPSNSTITGVEDLAGHRLALPSEDNVLSEEANKALLRADVEPTRVRFENAAAAHDAVAAGDADASVAFAGLFPSSLSAAFELPRTLARFVAMATSDSPEATRLLRYLESDPAKQIVTDLGFAMP